MKRLLVYGVLLLLPFVFANAQDDASNAFKPVKGDWTVEYTFGKSLVPSSSMQWTMGVGTPVLSNPSPTVSYVLEGSTITNLNGIKARYFASDNFALRLSAAYGQSLVPAKDEVPGVPYLLDDMGQPIAGTGLPFVQATEEQMELQVRVNFGMEYHFNMESERLDVYLGGVFNSAMARSESISRTYLDETAAAAGDYVIRVGAGPRWSESTILGGSAVAGIDCYILPVLYVGMEFNVFDYVYSYQEYVPEAGVDALSSESHNISAFSYPQLKIGIKL